MILVLYLDYSKIKCGSHQVGMCSYAQGFTGPAKWEWQGCIKGKYRTNYCFPVASCGQCTWSRVLVVRVVILSQAA